MTVVYQCGRCDATKRMYNGMMPPMQGCSAGGLHSWIRASGQPVRYQCSRCGKSKVMYLGGRSPQLRGCVNGSMHSWIRCR